MDTLDMDSIQDVMLTLYEQLCDPNNIEQYEMINQVAFGYYHLIRRKEDIDPECVLKGLLTLDI